MMTKLYTELTSRYLKMKSTRGQTLVEYGLILALVSIVVIVALTFLGETVSEIFSEIGSELS